MLVMGGWAIALPMGRVNWSLTCTNHEIQQDFLCDLWKPPSMYPAFLQVTDIAGLIRGASQGEGLGNAFLSHIQAVDGMFHIVRYETPYLQDGALMFYMC